MFTFLDIIQRSEAFLKERGITNARRQAEDLIASVFQLKRMDLYLRFDEPLEEVKLEECRAALKRRGKREPLAYIFGEVDFGGAHFKVDPCVLIPRMESEILIEKVATLLKECEVEGKVLWDVCCGSGCLGISLKKRFPHLRVILSDICPKALEVAKTNAALNQVEVEFCIGDLWEPFHDQQCDFLICNPPYIGEKDYLLLDPEVRCFEPKKALVGGETGLEFYERLAKGIKEYVKASGKVWLEMGYNQGNRIKVLFESCGWLGKVEQDWAGHDRFFSLDTDSFYRVSL